MALRELLEEFDSISDALQGIFKGISVSLWGLIMAFQRVSGAFQIDN